MNFKKLFLNNLDIFYIIVAITLKAVFYEHTVSPDYFSLSLIVPPVLASVAIVSSLSLLMKNKGRTRFLYIFNAVMSLIIIADTVYYRYFKDVISISVVRNGVMLSGVSSSVKSLFSPTDLLYLADCLLTYPLLRIYRRKVDRPQLGFKSRLAFFLILFCLSVGFDAHRIYALSVDQPRLISTMYNRIYVDKMLGCVNFHLLDAYNVVSTKISNIKPISAERTAEIESYLEQKNTPEGTVLSGEGKGKNLIVIQVEALQEFVIGKEINGKEITPNLNRWIDKSLYFNNYYYQVASGNTSDAEFLSLNSLYPAATGAAYYIYPGDTLNSTPKQFNDLGYNTVALNGYQEGFWNRSVMYKAEEFSEYYAGTSYTAGDKVGLGLSDKSFFEQSLIKMQSFEQPYYAFLITLSSHYPYDDQEGYNSDLDVGSYQGTLLGDYLNGIHYTDAQIGMFLDQLEKSGVLDNSIVVLYGDHYAIPKEEADQLFQFEGIENPTDLDWSRLQKVPLLIHFPGDAIQSVNSIPAGQIDLYPTLANLFGLDRKYMFGTDLINAKTNVVSFRNGSYTDGHTFYVASSDTYYDMTTGKAISPTEAMLAQKDKTLLELSYSDDILNHNLLKKFINADSDESEESADSNGSTSSDQ